MKFPIERFIIGTYTDQNERTISCASSVLPGNFYHKEVNVS